MMSRALAFSPLAMRAVWRVSARGGRFDGFRFWDRVAEAEDGYRLRAVLEAGRKGCGWPRDGPYFLDV